MKQVALIIVLFIGIVGFGKPQVYLSFKTFYTLNNEAYASVSLQFLSGTFKYESTAAGILSSKIEITHIFSAKDTVSVFDKYILNSPAMKDSTVEDFYDIQRYKLEPGIYEYELIIKDLISGEIISGKQSIRIDLLDKKVIAFSDIEFIEDAFKSSEQSNFVKNGLFILPYMTNYFPPEINKIAFYTEIYNSAEVFQKDEQFLITASIANFKTGIVSDDIFKFQKVTANAIVPILMYLPIDNLPSGDYNLIVNIINKVNDTVTSKIEFFQRRNDLFAAEKVPINDVQIDRSFQTEIYKDSIPYFLASIMPISEQYEYETIRKILKTNDTSYMHKYFYAFWKETDPSNPYLAWVKYKKQVQYAQKLFGTQIKAGFDTDRGRIHLKYGSPNSIVDRPNEPSAYPYQIWHYYRIGLRSNIKFVFYNPDLVTNDYPMLHSDMQGELQNYRWPNDLHKRDNPNTDLDNPGGSKHYGGTSESLFKGGM